ncbi:MAG: hypothetical protein WC935_07325, partial [Thermoleophilia bacterium]
MSGRKTVLAALVVFAALILMPLIAQVPAERELFKNTNIFAVQNAPTSATVFSVDSPHIVTYIMTYHYFNYGVLPGSIV